MNNDPFDIMKSLSKRLLLGIEGLFIYSLPSLMSDWLILVTLNVSNICIEHSGLFQEFMSRSSVEARLFFFLLQVKLFLSSLLNLNRHKSLACI